jgi:transcriptional regulator with XRE-family HTH domain
MIEGMKFIKLLEKYRGGVLPTDLARKVKVTPSFMMMVCSGSRKPNNEMCARIAAALNLTQEQKDLLTMAAIEERMDEKDLAFIKRIRMETIGDMNKDDMYRFCPQCGFKLR